METALQMPLVSSAQMPDAIFLEGESARRGCYTAERLLSRKPEIYARVLQLLVEGEYRTRVAELCGVDHRTVAAVAARHPEAIPTAKRRVALRFLESVELQLDLAQRLAANGDARGSKDALIGAGIADEHWQLLAGEPTSRVESDVTVGSEHEWFNAWIGSSAGIKGAKSIDVEAIEGRSDSKSLGDRCAATGSESNGAGCIPEVAGPGPVVAAAPGQEGGGGVREAEGEAGERLDATGSENFNAKGGSEP